jgi:CoA:oxalate CoA-transferase
MKQRQQPLQGIRVIDLTHVLAGPWCTMMLRHLGAQVIKVEMPYTGDDARQFGPFLDGQPQRSAYFMSINSGKQSLALNLKAAAGKQILWDLILRADVLVENYRPGTLERLGFAAEEILAANPRIVFASISGFGQTGPDSGLPAYDIIIQALSGLMSITGTEDGNCVKVGASISDLVAGIYTALGIAAALVRRERTGAGGRVDVAMLDSAVSLLENAIARYQASGETPRPLGSRHPSITPFDTFRAQDALIVIAVGNDRLFAALCDTLGKPGLAQDPRFSTNALRTEHAASLKREINAGLGAHTCAHWLQALAEQGIPCARVRRIPELLEDAQLRQRDMFVPVGDRGFLAVGNPIKFADAGARALEPAPELGADSIDILRELLGYSPEAISQLVATGVVQAGSPLE